MTKNQVGIARKILNNNPQIRQELRNPIDTGDGYIITDGFRLVKTKENIALLKEDVCNIYETLMSNVLNEASKNDGESIDAPSINTLNDYIREYKKSHDGERGVGYQIVNDVWVNAYYLRDILTLLPKSTIRFARVDREYKKIYFESKNGQGVLYPLRKHIK